jgi:hypothetical protein
VRASAIAITGTILTALAGPAAASGATVRVAPHKACYRPGERPLIGGGGYTPNGGVQLNLDGHFLSSGGTDATGNFGGTLTIGEPFGEHVNAYTVIDLTNNAVQASIQLRTSSVTVRLPESGLGGRRVRIKVRGFTTGKTLYMHIVRGHRRLTRRVGRLKGACHKLSVRKAIFSRRAKPGKYTLQFDTKRHYSTKTKVRKHCTFRVSQHVAAVSRTITCDEP